jgi:hypothetical protein
MARPELFAALKSVLTPVAGSLSVTADSPTSYALAVPGYRYRDQPSTPFAWVKDGKSYVSFHLFPIYTIPDLVDRVPACLRARMQGKSCFNFKNIEPELVDELRTVVERVLPRFRKQLEERAATNS